MNIAQALPGDRIRLVDFGCTKIAYRRRLLALGCTLGTELRIVHIAPLGCPVHVVLRGTDVALRKKETEHLHWEAV